MIIPGLPGKTLPSEQEEASYGDHTAPGRRRVRAPRRTTRSRCACPSCSSGRFLTAAASRSGGWTTSSSGSAAADYPLVTGLVAAVGGRQIFVPLDQVSSFDGDPVRLSSARLDLRHFERRDGEVLLRADVLGHRLIDVANARLVRAADLELAKDGEEWVLAGVDTRRRPRRLFGLLGPRDPDDARAFRDWHDFEWLIGHEGSALLRSPFARIRRLKPAQIADLLEERLQGGGDRDPGPGARGPRARGRRVRGTGRGPGHAPARRADERRDRRRAGPDARRRRRGRDRRTAPAAPAAHP